MHPSLDLATPSLDVLERCVRRREAAARGAAKITNVSFLIFDNKNATFRERRGGPRRAQRRPRGAGHGRGASQRPPRIFTARSAQL